MIGIPMHKQVHPLFNMSQPKQKDVSPQPFGIASPWKLDPGNPEYPNRHPFLTHLGAPQDLKEASKK